MAQNSFPNLFNYIDDLIYTGLPSEIHSSFTFLKELLSELGLDISFKKLVPPSTTVTCLGILVDSITKTVSIPADKLQEIIQLCVRWTTKTYCSKQDLQSLLGSLLYVTRCVKHSRCFLNRMLQMFRNNVQSRKILITQDFRNDLAWFNQFLTQYNGGQECMVNMCTFQYTVTCLPYSRQRQHIGRLAVQMAVFSCKLYTVVGDFTPTNLGSNPYRPS